MHTEPPGCFAIMAHPNILRSLPVVESSSTIAVWNLFNGEIMKDSRDLESKLTPEAAL
jgi:hypothetical protein